MSTLSVSLPEAVEVVPGARFGRLVIVSHAGGGRWTARCDCGRLTTVARALLVAGKVRSCGCLLRGHGHRKPRRGLLPVAPLLPLLEAYRARQPHPGAVEGSWAALSRRTGISERAFNRWDRGEAVMITTANAKLLAHALGHSAIAIWGLDTTIAAGGHPAGPDARLDLAVTGAERLFTELAGRGLSPRAARVAARLCVQLDEPHSSSDGARVAA